MNLQEQILSQFSKLKNIVSIHLFGSQTSNYATDKSDVDVAILFKNESIPNAMELIQLRESLSDKLQKDVDLVCLNTASPIIAMQVLEKGEKLYIADQKAYSKFVIRLITDYSDLKMIRHTMEENITKRKYYG